jgi:hypothetical protein
MSGGTKTGLSTISLGRLQCVRRVSDGPKERRRRRIRTLGTGPDFALEQVNE